MNHLRLATQEEVDTIKAESELTLESFVVALDSKDKTNLAVVRRVMEVDPVYFKGGDVQKARFMWGLEERLIGMGVGAYYFNVPADDETYREGLKAWGAEQLSKQPEIRFVKRLVK